MRTYILHRLLAAIPIVFGAIMLTFVLFNVVGGSPAETELARSATVDDLERYDAQHGFNLPLLFSRWGTTRALRDTDFRNGPGEWDGTGLWVSRASDGFAWIELSASATPYRAPLRCALAPGALYRWRFRYTLGPGGEAAVVHTSNGKAVASMPLDPATAWRNAAFEWVAGEAPREEALEIHVRRGTMRIRSSALRWRTERFGDTQFFRYLAGLARFDLGVSARTNERVSDVLRRGIGPSLALTLPIFFGSLLVSVCAALVCAYARDRVWDRALVLGATVLMSVNYVVWVVVGQFVFAYWMGWFPIWGFESWWHLALPVFIGMATGCGRDLRFYRAVILEELHKDYVRTAFAKGLPPRAVLTRHVLRNALIPIVTNISLSLPFLFTGSLLLESFFGIPGLGGETLAAIHSADYPVVRAIVWLGALLYVVVNVATDVLYAWADPRVRLTGEGA